jgi:probable FeS assembly SUF system protein SufT
MSEEKVLLLSRDCDAIQVPYGNTITAREGTKLFLVHQLGDTYTVRTEHGYLLRIAMADASALGLSAAVPAPADGPASRPGPVEEADLWEVLKTIYDPEIPSNIVELGLIYTVKASPLPDGHQHVDVSMTLTAPGCGMGQVLQDDVERKLLEVPVVKSVQVQLTFTPPWDPTMMSDAARLQLGMM